MGSITHIGSYGLSYILFDIEDLIVGGSCGDTTVVSGNEALMLAEVGCCSDVERLGITVGVKPKRE